MIYVTCYSSPVGKITIGSDGNALVGLWFEGQKHFLSGHKESEIKDDIEVFRETKKWLDEYFKGENPPVTMPISPSGSDFQKKVWAELRKIPFGETVTYSYVAKRIGVKSAQAVGNAVGRNPISIIVPCHRVVGKNGTLTGFAAGLDKKLFLLRLENKEV